jgi:hypothetical protein
VRTSRGTSSSPRECASEAALLRMGEGAFLRNVASPSRTARPASRRKCADHWLHRQRDLDQTTAAGRGQRWAVDGPAPNALARMGISSDFLKADDVIEVCGFVMKAQFESVSPGQRHFACPAHGSESTACLWRRGRERGRCGRCLRGGSTSAPGRSVYFCVGAMCSNCVRQFASSE